MDHVNGSDAEVKSQLPEAIIKMQEAIPEFGSAWKTESFQNPEAQGHVIMVLTLPEGSAEVVRFVSQINIMTSRGPAQLGFTIPGVQNIGEAALAWRSAAQAAIAEMHINLQQQQKRIIVPDAAQRAALPLKKLVTN